MTLQRILVVDDSAAMRSLLRRILLSFGPKISVTEARDGLHAFEVFEQTSPSVILLDWDMPNTSGIDFLNRFAKHLPKVVVGMVTANHSPNQKAIAREMGAAFVLAKPFTRDALRQQVAPYLKMAYRSLNQPTSPSSPQVSTLSIEHMVLAAINRALKTSAQLHPAPAHTITGSAGIAASLTNGSGLPRVVISMDWALCEHLNAVLSGATPTQDTESLRTKRTTPQMRENLREIVNIVRGVCQLHINEDIEFDSIAFRGDGVLRNEAWQILLNSASFKEARGHFMDIQLSRLGGGCLSIYILPQCH